MRAGDRLVAVAGESVEALRHEETVSRIREQGSRVTLIVVDAEADRFFRMVGAERREGREQSRAECNRFAQSAPQVRLSPLLFLESTEAAASSQATNSTSPVETENRPAEHRAGFPGPPGSSQCFLYPGPGGAYGFRLSCMTTGPHLFISQVTDAP